MKQLALDIGLATGPALGNYFAGANEAALQHLRLWVGQGSQQATRASCCRRCCGRCTMT